MDVNRRHHLELVSAIGAELTREIVATYVPFIGSGEGARLGMYYLRNGYAKIDDRRLNGQEAAMTLFGDCKRVTRIVFQDTVAKTVLCALKVLKGSEMTWDAVIPYSALFLTFYELTAIVYFKQLPNMPPVFVEVISIIAAAMFTSALFDESMWEIGSGFFTGIAIDQFIMPHAIVIGFLLSRFFYLVD